MSRTLRSRRAHRVPLWVTVGVLAIVAPPLARAAPQTVGTSFLAMTSVDYPSYPPDGNGDVGPTQILVCTNAGIRVFDRSGTLGPLNMNLTTFFTSVAAGAAVFDPRVRYDRLSGRWFVVAATLSSPPNRVLVAVSSGPTITGAGSFTFYGFLQNAVPDLGVATIRVADLSFGVDAHALYVGANAYTNTTGYESATLFIINKANLLAGTLTVRAFRHFAVPGGGGPYAPQAASNDDPASTEGYFVGVDIDAFSRLDLVRVINPGETPSWVNTAFNVNGTYYPNDVPTLGSLHALSGNDDRLIGATVHRNKNTGITSLWTAQNIRSSYGGAALPNGDRDASRWYELTNLGGTPNVAQSGTFYDSSRVVSTSIWVGTVAGSGQGHMAMGATYAGSQYFAGVAVAGRLAGDPPGALRDKNLAQVSPYAYNASGGPGDQPWGTVSATVVDPTDDMTIWTFQEYAAGSDTWGIRVIQLLAPPPAIPVSCVPAVIAPGAAGVSVTVTATSSPGPGWFDPGPDPGGPGYLHRVAASVGGAGVTVQNVSVTDPTHATLNLSVSAGAATGMRTVTMTNPDGQSSTSPFGILNIANTTATPAAALPVTFSLGRNSPNPVRDRTSIGYGLPVEAPVRLEVIDVAGHRVAMLVNETQPAGFHEARFERGAVADGVYFLSLRAGPFRAAEKMLVVR